MTEVEVVSLHPLAAGPLALALLLVGAYATGLVAELARGRGPGAAAAVPVRRAALWLAQQPTTTERPDGTLWWLAPAFYLGTAGLALSVVPLGTGVAIADVRTGIVVFGVAEVFAIVAVHLQGWSPNSYLPLVGGTRFIAMALSFELLSMFVLIAAAIPAQSLAVGEIVTSQAGLWNVVRQPLGLPLFLVVALGIALWGPLDAPAGDDIAGGVVAESAGPNRLVWELGRHALLAVFAAMAAAVFLGGWHGPVLPGWAWMAVKTVALLALLVWLGERLPRPTPERFVRLTWLVLLPLGFLDLLIAGVGSLP